MILTFKEIIGNEKIKNMLDESINNNNILHSYIFIGQVGIGKYLIAEEFAKGILCQGSDKKPCGMCKSCIEFEGKNNPDFLVINPDGNSIKINQIRVMNEKIFEKPVISNRKVYIINDAEYMTKEAQNSLLKTLEEPPEYAIFILICNQKGKILTTIQSRCMNIDFVNLSSEQIKQYCIKNNIVIPDQVLKFSEGSISKTMERLEYASVYEQLENLMNNVEKMSKLDFLNSEFIYQYKDNIKDLLNVMNIILWNIAKTKDNSINYLNCVNIVERTKERLNLNGNFDMNIDNLLLDMWEEINETNSWS